MLTPTPDLALYKAQHLSVSKWDLLTRTTNQYSIYSRGETVTYNTINKTRQTATLPRDYTYVQKLKLNPIHSSSPSKIYLPSAILRNFQPKIPLLQVLYNWTYKYRHRTYKDSIPYQTLYFRDSGSRAKAARCLSKIE